MSPPASILLRYNPPLINHKRRCWLVCFFFLQRVLYPFKKLCQSFSRKKESTEYHTVLTLQHTVNWLEHQSIYIFIIQHFLILPVLHNYL